MKILAVDTAAKTVSAALGDGEKVLSSVYADTGLTHSQTLLPLIDFCLKSANTKVDEIDAFAVCTGPGSFTGVRIGAAAIKGLARGQNKPCIELSTLEELAHHLRQTDCTCMAAMDARCNQVYCALFEIKDGEVIRLTDDMALMISETEKYLEGRENIIFVGDGAGACAEYYKDKMPVKAADEVLLKENAVFALKIAEEKYRKGETVNSAELMPSYLRLPQAERELRKKQGLKG